jgi:hypothetical protein
VLLKPNAQCLIPSAHLPEPTTGGSRHASGSWRRYYLSLEIHQQMSHHVGVEVICNPACNWRRMDKSPLARRERDDSAPFGPYPTQPLTASRAGSGNGSNFAPAIFPPAAVVKFLPHRSGDDEASQPQQVPYNLSFEGEFAISGLVAMTPTSPPAYWDGSYANMLGSHRFRFDYSRGNASASGSKSRVRPGTPSI